MIGDYSIVAKAIDQAGLRAAKVRHFRGEIPKRDLNALRKAMSPSHPQKFAMADTDDLPSAR